MRIQSNAYTNKNENSSWGRYIQVATVETTVVCTYGILGRHRNG